MNGEKLSKNLGYGRSHPCKFALHRLSYEKEITSSATKQILRKNYFYNDMPHTAACVSATLFRMECGWCTFCGLTC